MLSGPALPGCSRAAEEGVGETVWVTSTVLSRVVFRVLSERINRTGKLTSDIPEHQKLLCSRE
jgi:hypothetical protein